MTDRASAEILPWPGNVRPRDRLGRPMHDLRISVMDRCNFRCPYCMPRETYHERYEFLKSAERLSFEEITRIARLAAGLGVSKLRLTGGEPLLRTGLADLVGELSTIDGVEDLALTTNGILLAQQAARLQANGLKRVTVSLDTLDEEVFHRMSGGFGGVAKVLDGIDAALEAGLAPVKVNAVVQRGVNDQTIPALLERFRGTPVIVRLIEYMDVGNRNHWDRAQVVPSAELLARIRALWPLTPQPGHYRGEVAERYTYDDGGGRDRLHFLDQRTVLRRLQPRAPVLRGHALYLSVRDVGHRPARPAARRRQRPGARFAAGGGVDRPAAIATANSERRWASASTSCTRSR